MRYIIYIILLFLVACGGGSSSSQTSPPPPQPPPLPTISLSVTPTAPVAGQPITITWSSTNATSCSGSGFNGFTVDTTNGTTTVVYQNSGQVQYSITCINNVGSATGIANVTYAPITSISVSLEVSQPSIAISGSGYSGTWSVVQNTASGQTWENNQVFSTTYNLNVPGLPTAWTSFGQGTVTHYYANQPNVVIPFGEDNGNVNWLISSYTELPGTLSVGDGGILYTEATVEGLTLTRTWNVYNNNDCSLMFELTDTYSLGTIPSYSNVWVYGVEYDGVLNLITVVLFRGDSSQPEITMNTSWGC